MRVAVAAASLAVALAGCAGGHTGTPASPAASASTSGVAGATIQISVPAATTATSASSRHATYVSPSTASIKIVIGSTTFNQNLSANAPGCTAASPNSPQAFTCALAVTASVGTSSLTVTTYDGAGQTGNILSSTAVSFTPLVEGAANVIPLVLNAVPSSVTIAPLPAPNPQYLVGGSGGYTLYGTDTVQLAVQAYDADGNAIIGPGSPSYQLGTNNVSALPVPGTPVSGTSNVFAIAAVSGFADGAQVLVSAYATPTNGSPVTAQIAVTLRHILVYTTELFGSTTKYLDIYTDRSTSGRTRTTLGLNGPIAVAVDHNRTAYVANSQGAAVTIYPYGQTSPNSLTIPVTAAQGIAVDASGTVYVAANYLNQVTEYPAGSSSASLTNPGPPFTNPYGVAVNGAGQVAITDAASNTMNIYAAGSTGSPTTFGINGARGDYYDRAGNLWVASLSIVGEYAPGATTPFFTITGFSEALGVAVDIAGYVYVTDYAAGNVYVLPPGATSASSAIETITGLTNNGGIAVWPN